MSQAVLDAQVIAFEDLDGRVCLESGSNWETACLTGAICAERTCLCKMRERRPKQILKASRERTCTVKDSNFK